MKTIIHLSDLHVGFGECGVRMRQIVTNIIYLKEPASQYVVVCTGDLVDDANQDGLYQEVALHLQRLRQAGFTVLVCPGNHDYGTGSLANQKFVSRFKEHFFGDPTVTYPKLDVIEGVAFIGLDSMAEELHWYDALCAQGELGKAQLDRLATLLRSAGVRQCEWRVVYLHHHPFDPQFLHELKDSAALGETLQCAANQGSPVQALLYGHNHGGKIRNGKWGIPRCYDDGSATHKLESPGHHRVIDLERDPRQDYPGRFD